MSSISRDQKALGRRGTPTAGKGKKTPDRGKPRSGSHHTSLTKFLGSRKLPEGKSLRSLDERKVVTLGDTESVNISSLLVNPLQVYRFRLGGYTTLSRTSGVVNSFLAAIHQRPVGTLQNGLHSVSFSRNSV